jgi:hypothetical protein
LERAGHVLTSFLNMVADVCVYQSRRSGDSLAIK